MEHPIHTLADGAASPALTSRLDAGIAAWAQLVDAVREAALHAQVVAAGEAVTNALTGGHKILVAGNGGSAAIASHV